MIMFFLNLNFKVYFDLMVLSVDLCYLKVVGLFWFIYVVVFCYFCIFCLELDLCYMRSLGFW